ncbi:hypothetical protein [Geoalkalibacter sp.]|uniref:hypothetical protein n=1 Tax=Geoalkalibacter sp. TaxID=3041440 RepID=UPI00272E277C|nr:hypothetical protein [Geoalkalibacter sp.]
MGQITIYLDAETEKHLREAAKRNGISQSKWVAELIRKQTATVWPEAVAELAGAWGDFPEPETLRRATGNDVPRETF